MGAGQVVPGFEAGVVGMQAGETRRIEIASDDAYGPHRPELLLEVPRDRLPADLDPSPGDILMARAPTGEAAQVMVAEVGETTVTLDGNHPLAGKDLVFEIQLVEIV